MSTRVTQTNQVLPNCSLEKPTCTYLDVNSTEHFVADIGNFTVALPPSRPSALLFSAPDVHATHRIVRVRAPPMAVWRRCR